MRRPCTPHRDRPGRRPPARAVPAQRTGAGEPCRQARRCRRRPVPRRGRPRRRAGARRRLPAVRSRSSTASAFPPWRTLADVGVDVFAGGGRRPTAGHPARHAAADRRPVPPTAAPDAGELVGRLPAPRRRRGRRQPGQHRLDRPQRRRPRLGRPAARPHQRRPARPPGAAGGDGDGVLAAPRPHDETGRRARRSLDGLRAATRSPPIRRRSTSAVSVRSGRRAPW